MTYEELKQSVYKLNRQEQLALFYKLLGWFEASPDNKEFCRAVEEGLKEFQGNVEMGLNPTFYCPARLDSHVEKNIKEIALRAHHAGGVVAVK